MYNKNICCHYIKEYIMTINIFIVHESVFLLYETMYNKNICCYYTRDHIITTNIFIVHESVFLIIQDNV